MYCIIPNLLSFLVNNFCYRVRGNYPFNICTSHSFLYSNELDSIAANIEILNYLVKPSGQLSFLATCCPLYFYLWIQKYILPFTVVLLSSSLLTTKYNSMRVLLQIICRWISHENNEICSELLSDVYCSGKRVSDGMLNLMALRYGASSGHMTLESFISLILRFDCMSRKCIWTSDRANMRSSERKWRKSKHPDDLLTTLSSFSGTLSTTL